MNTNHGYQLCNDTTHDEYIVNFRDPARFVELFIISEQVMTDDVAYEDFNNVFGIGYEF